MLSKQPYFRPHGHGNPATTVPAGVKAHVAEALDDEGLVAPARGLANHGHVGGLKDEVLQAVVHAATRR
jgi:hypothetical protein